jgi:ATP-dependent 26S proteasome regulatory subunit
VLAATNRPWDLDPALIRPGRMDALIFVSLPHQESRRQILRVHCDGVCLAEDVDLDMLATLTDLFSGAELASVCQEAILFCAARNAAAVSMSDFTQALQNFRPRTSRQDLIRYCSWGG